jgi:uncharacterized repeat protein (TIGR03803 family)
MFPVSRFSALVLLACISTHLSERRTSAGAEPSPGDVVRVTLRNGKQRDFAPAADTNAARGAALVNAVAYVNDLARAAAEDGCVFRSALVRHSDGNFYGTATVGGMNDRAGVIFQLTPAGKYRVIHHFQAASGTNSRASLVEGADKALYGTAEGGGGGGYGVVFRVTTTGNYSVLHEFDKAGGAYPVAPLCRASDGNFYGTTPLGGDHDIGLLFRILPKGNFVAMHSFSEAEGSHPKTGLVEMGGALYGVALQGGGAAGWGTVFRLGFDNSFSVLHTFAGPDGAFPLGALCPGPGGWLYGTTFCGGSGFIYTTGLHRGQGTVFKIKPTGEFVSLYSFNPAHGGGQFPVAGLMASADGFLYGTTREGGQLNHGTVFRIDSHGRVRVIESMRGKNGYLPSAPLIEGVDGDLYGTAQLGGRSNAGAIFRVQKNGARTTVLRSAPLPDAAAQISIGTGTYDVPVLYMRGANIQMAGAGMSKTVVRRADGLNVINEGVIRGIYFSGLAGGGFTVSDLTVDCNLQGQSVPVNAGGVGLQGSRVKISNVRAINWGSRIADAECFVLAMGTSGGGELAENFILGEAHDGTIENCVVETPAPVAHAGTVTAISVNGGFPPNFFFPGDGWFFNPLIHDCIVRGSTDPTANPPALQGYSISMTVGGVVRDNLAEDLVGNSGGHCGFYHDTGSIMNASIHSNRFLNCNRGVFFSLSTTTAVLQKSIHIFDNTFDCPPGLPESAGVLFSAGNLNEIHDIDVRKNSIMAAEGLHFEGTLPVTGVYISGNIIDAATPWTLKNVEFPVITNNHTSTGQPLP